MTPSHRKSWPQHVRALDCIRGKRKCKEGVSTNFWIACALLLTAVFASGCGDDFSRVGGRITLDGKPLAGGENVAVTVLFYPESGRGSPAAALADENGDYFVSTGARKGLPPGNYIVTLSAAQMIQPPSGGAPTKKILTPARYANPKLSGLSTEVKPGRNTFDIQLQSDGGGRS
jgi:hypothetical protein